MDHSFLRFIPRCYRAILGIHLSDMGFPKVSKITSPGETSLSVYFFNFMLWSLKLLSMKIWNTKGKMGRHEIFFLAALGGFKIKSRHPLCSIAQSIPFDGIFSNGLKCIPRFPWFIPLLAPAGKHHFFSSCPLSSIFHFRCLLRQRKIKLSAFPCTKVLYGISSPVCHSSLNSYPLHSHPDLCKWTFA